MICQGGQVDNVVTAIPTIALIAFVLIFFGSLALACRNIFRRLGFPGWFWVLMFVPLINYITIIGVGLSRRVWQPAQEASQATTLGPNAGSD